MPGFPFPGRPGGEHDEPLLDMIIARRVLPPDAPQPMHDLASMLAALAGPAEPGELAGEAAVRAAFSRAASPASISSAARRPWRRRRPRRFRGPARSRARLATALVGGGRAGQRLRGLHRRPAQPHSATGARHGGGAGPAHLRRAPARHGREVVGHVPHAPAQQPARPRAAPLDEPGSGSRPADPDAELQAQPDRVTRSRGHRAVLRPGPGPLAESAAEGGSGYPSLPSWYQGEHCTGIPTRPSDEPTLHPYVPGTQSS